MTRDEALKKMQAVKSYMTSGNPIWSVTEIGEAFDMAIEALEQPERKTGEWIQRNPQNSTECRLLTCSECDRSYIVGFNVQYDEWVDSHKFCINCGARMVQEGEDNDE